MFPYQYTIAGSLGGSEELFYFLKTLNFFETLVKREGEAQRIPADILRVLKPCRGFITRSATAFYVVLAYLKDDDQLAQTLMTIDLVDKDFGIDEAQRLGVPWLFQDKTHGDPLTLRFPRQAANTEYAQTEAVLMAIVQKYLVFEIGWAKQRGLILEPKPFFPGKYFKPDFDLVFVLMPFAQPYDDIYQGCIKPTIEELSARPVRADDVFHNKPIMEVIWELINKAVVVVADLTGRNANVFYEVGIAHTLGKEVILLAQSMDDIPFDLRHVNVIVYQWTPPGAQKMKAKLAATLHTILRERRHYGR